MGAELFLASAHQLNEPLPREVILVVILLWGNELNELNELNKLIAHHPSLFVDFVIPAQAPESSVMVVLCYL